MPETDPSTRIVAPRPETMKPPSAFSSSWSDPPPPDEADDPLIGTTLQRTYRITRIIGEGGMGRVYEATHTRIKQKRYALKVLHPEFAREPEIRTRFQREAEAAASVSHPNVVGVYDVALTDQGWPFLVCEYLEGVDFAALVRSRETLTPALAVHVVLQVCDALITAHDSGVIHRDLKPQNVFILGESDETRPLAKVLDFGLSRFTNGSDNELTKTGMIMGTPSYMAPEQARGERADQLTDVYGVGAILYAAVTGRPPFNSESPQATILAVMNDEPERPHTLNPAVSVYLEMVIQKAMAKKASERYPDMRSLRGALAALDVGNRPSLASLPRTPAGVGYDLSEVKTARSQLVFHSLSGLVASIATIGVAVSGAVYLIVGRWPFSRNEVFLAVLAVLGTLLTPGLMLLKKLRRGVWGSTARVVAVLQLVRSPLIAGLLAYGAASLAVRFVDAAVLGVPEGTAWPGWNVILSGIALVTALLAWARARWLGTVSTIRRLLLGPASTAFVVGICCASLYQGLIWQNAAYEAPAAEPLATTTPVNTVEPLAAPKLPDVATTAAASAAPEASAETSPTTDEASELAPSEAKESAPASELTEAISKGLPALLPLSVRYPTDAKVIRALAMEYGSRSTGLDKAMETLSKVFALDPTLAQDKDLQYMVINTTQRNPPASKLAYKLMAESMGSEGTDLLYKLSLTKPNQRSTTNKYLTGSTARKQFSEALAIAYDLRFSPSCAGRLPLLERARAVGDKRSISVLAPLANGTASGCGSRKRKPCPARCPSQAAAFQEAIDDIAKRLSHTK